LVKDRVDGCLVVLLCDGDARLIQPVALSDPPESPTDEERRHVLGVFTHAMGAGGSILLAIARKDGLSITPGDQAWARAMVAVCGDDLRPLGAYVVTVEGSREVPTCDLAA
jgi:hypothetical protein